MEGSTPQFTPVEQPKKSNAGMIIGIVVVVLLCCCCLVIAGVLLFMGPMVGSVYSSVNQQLTAMPEIPTIPDGTSEPGIPIIPEGTLEPGIPTMPALPADIIPQGGLGDDVLRANTWAYVIIVAVTDGCNSPNAADTAITVTQEQDAGGVWKERWLVACDGSESVPVDVTFTPSANGGTDINVTKGK